VKEEIVRATGLDVHLEFCEVAIAEGGEVRSAGRIETKPDQVELFARSFGAENRVALEVTGNAWEIKRLIESHVAEVMVVSPADTGVRGARTKTDRLDTLPLAKDLSPGWIVERASHAQGICRCTTARTRCPRHVELVCAHHHGRSGDH